MPRGLEPIRYTSDAERLADAKLMARLISEDFPDLRGMKLALNVEKCAPGVGQTAAIIAAIALATSRGETGE